MDKTNVQSSSGAQQHPLSNTGDPNTFYPRGGQYLGPPPMHPGCDPSRNTFQSNMTSPSTFWPGQNPPQYVHPSQQAPISGQRFPHSQEWTPPPVVSGYGSQQHVFRPQFTPPPPRFDGYGPPMSHGYGFDPSMPPPSLSNPGAGQFPPMFNDPQRTLHGPPESGSSAPGNSWTRHGYGVGDMGDSTNKTTFVQHPAYPGTGPPQHSQYGFQPNSSPDPSFRHKHGDSGYSENRSRPLLSSPSMGPYGREYQSNQGIGKPLDTQPLDEESIQRTQDEQWLKRFLKNREKTPMTPKDPKQMHAKLSVTHIRDNLYGAVQLVSKLSVACETLKLNLENDSVWADSHAKALSLKYELQEKLKVFSDSKCVDNIKKKIACISKRRARQRRRKLAQIEEKQMEDERLAEREAAIDKWRMKRIHEVEEKKREQELKLAADTVLSEVRKKQGDAKRMLDILRSLEKLRKLRKEAASRKGIFPEQQDDQTFDDLVERLRVLIRKRTAVYGAEENALRVMLEGEQEEERKRDLEKRQKKERERQLQKKQEMETMLFGAEMPPHHPLQAFRGYYTQAEHSLPALIQIRRDWDLYLVPVDHLNGTSVPQGWVLPEAPSDEVWATALDRGD